MKTLSVSEFKTHALSVFDRISKSGEEVVVTKRGKPVARVVSYEKPESKLLPGKLAGTITFENDILSPLGADLWDAAADR